MDNRVKVAVALLLLLGVILLYLTVFSSGPKSPTTGTPPQTESPEAGKKPDEKASISLESREQKKKWTVPSQEVGSGQKVLDPGKKKAQSGKKHTWVIEGQLLGLDQLHTGVANLEVFAIYERDKESSECLEVVTKQGGVFEVDVSALLAETIPIDLEVRVYHSHYHPTQKRVRVSDTKASGEVTRLEFMTMGEVN